MSVNDITDIILVGSQTRGCH
ncbi:hypothetical protein [Photobacterium leiognathi]